MNLRERALVIILGALVILLGGGVLGYRFFYEPLDLGKKKLANLVEEAEKKQEKLVQAESDRQKLVQYRELSLPSDLDLANRKYAKYLGDLFTRHGVPRTKCTIDSSRSHNVETGNPRTKGPQVFTRLTFNVVAYANLATLVAIMEDFYHTGLLHEIKSFSLQKQTAAAAQDELAAKYTIEALIVDKGGQRTWLLPNIHPRYLAIDLACNLQRGPGGLAMAVWAAGPTGPLGPNRLAGANNPLRDYKDIAKKNVFFGRQPQSPSSDKEKPQWLVPRFNYLTDLTRHNLRTEGSLYDLANHRRVPLRSTSDGNTFPFIRDTEGWPIVQGTVVQLEDRLMRYRIGLYVEAAAKNNRAGAAGFFRSRQQGVDQLAGQQGDLCR